MDMYPILDINYQESRVCVSRVGNLLKEAAMTKKALCVGINDYPFDGSDLKGCVNDAKAWADMLVGHFGFAKSDVKLLLDAKATKANIMKGLKSLVKDAHTGDTLVFTNSSHGTYVKDEDGDEKAYDEAICPYDCARNLIVDDELRMLFDTVPDDVNLTVISDSCYSGTVTRLAPPGVTGYKKARFLSPAIMGRETLPNQRSARPRSKTQYTESTMKDILLSGCTDKEVSYDAEIDGKNHGAMTYFALKVIQDSQYKITFKELQSKLLKHLEDAKYPQHPRLEGKAANKIKEVFK
jgi:metacaspase-1